MTISIYKYLHSACKLSIVAVPYAVAGRGGRGAGGGMVPKDINYLTPSCKGYKKRINS